MKKLPVILDLETKERFRDVNHDRKKLGVSVVGLFDYATDSQKVFMESEFQDLFKILENASYIVGFNIKSFDLPVLQPYYPGKLTSFQVFDILDDIKDKIGRRLALNDLLFATFGKKKTGHGLMAIEYYKNGQFEKLKSYCLSDVMLTKELFEYGVKEGQVFYLNEVGKVSVKVDWKKYLSSSGGKDTHLTLPF